MKKYGIVRETNMLKINKSGFCSVYSNKKEADEACKHWNLLASKYGTQKTVVREMVIQ